jgi:SsrA-binding protein
MPAALPKVNNDATLAVNRRAYHDYFVEETYEAGLVLTGTEIKSLRAGKANLREGYARVRNGELWLLNIHIAPYDQGNIYNHEPTRDRKLLLHRRQINELMGKVQRSGLTLVPLRLYLKHGRAKLELGLARGKKQYDKREAIAERDARRDLERALRERHR